jgi:PEP-CTERM motif
MYPGVTTVTQPLDGSQGAGLMNANGAYLQLAAGQKSPTLTQATPFVSIPGSQVPLTGWDFNDVALSLTNFYALNTKAAGTLAITIDWYRDVAPAGGTNNILGMANLGLKLYSSPDNAYTNTPLVAQSLSTVDNVQHLWFTNAAAAYYEFAVGYNGYSNAVPGGGSPGLEQYSIAWSFTAVPEPSTLLLAGLGVTSLWWGMRRRRRK